MANGKMEHMDCYVPLKMITLHIKLNHLHFKVTIPQKKPDPRSDDNLNLRPTKKRPGSAKGLGSLKSTFISGQHSFSFGNVC